LEYGLNHNHVTCSKQTISPFIISLVQSDPVRRIHVMDMPSNRVIEISRIPILDPCTQNVMFYNIKERVSSPTNMDSNELKTNHHFKLNEKQDALHFTNCHFVCCAYWEYGEFWRMKGLRIVNQHPFYSGFTAFASVIICRISILPLSFFLGPSSTVT